MNQPRRPSQAPIRGPVHFMGVGGAGMVALAEAMALAGLEVSGCDRVTGPHTARLAELGVPVREGHGEDHVADVSTLVVTAAVPPDHPELEAARERGVTVLKRAEALGQWVAQGRVVAVAGTHGKTTTTAMTTAVLEAGGMDPTAFVGGRVQGWAGNLRAGSPDLFVVEADEYDRSFLTLSPDVAVVTNVEPDHLDIYGTPRGVTEGFRKFLDGRKESGRVIACADDPGASQLLTSVGNAAYTYGLGAGCQLRGEAVQESPSGTSCTVVEEGRPLGRLEIGLPGLHNLRNALAAAAVGRHLGVLWGDIARGLAGFRGVGRRFQRLGDEGGVAVVDDYAHHPTEVRATLQGARTAFPDRRVVAVFQPHLYSRTRDFAREFGEALALADVVFVTDVYPAREPAIPGVSGRLVVDAARNAGAGDVTYVEALDDAPAAVAGRLQPGDACLTLGAGTIESLGPILVEVLSRRTPAGSGAAHA